MLNRVGLRPPGSVPPTTGESVSSLGFPKLHLVLAQTFCKVLYGLVHVSYSFGLTFSFIPKLFM